ncbi:MAG: ParA family protein [Stellaceae bacterium]
MASTNRTIRAKSWICHQNSEGGRHARYSQFPSRFTSFARVTRGGHIVASTAGKEACLASRQHSIDRDAGGQIRNVYQLKASPIAAIRIIAVANHKGGAAKTTTAVNLAAGLVRKGRRVLLLDLDPQGNASSWLGVEADSGMFAVLAENRPVAAELHESSLAGLAVVPASQRLAGAERILAAELAAETILRRRLEETDLSAWDYVILDTPPALNLLTINALAAADEVLVPVEAHVLALSGVAQIAQTIGVVRTRLNPRLRLTGFVICRFDTRTRHSVEVRERLSAKFGDQVLHTVIRENIRLAEAPSFGAPIDVYAPTSPGAADYAALASEILAMERDD